MSKPRLRLLLRILALALVVFAVALATVWTAAMHTQPGTRLAVQYAAGFAPDELELTGVEGTLASTLRIGSLRYRDDSIDVAVEELALEVDFDALFVHRELRVQRIHASKVNIVTAGPSGGPARSGEAAAMMLPIPISIADASLPNVAYNGTQLAVGLAGRADVAGLDISVEVAAFDHEITATVSGPLDALHLEGRSNGAYPADFVAEIIVLPGQADVASQVVLREVLRPLEGRDGFVVENLQLDCRGTLPRQSCEIVLEVDDTLSGALAVGANVEVGPGQAAVSGTLGAGEVVGARYVGNVGWADGLTFDIAVTGTQKPVEASGHLVAIAGSMSAAGSAERVQTTFDDFALGVAGSWLRIDGTATSAVGRDWSALASTDAAQLAGLAEQLGLHEVAIELQLEALRLERFFADFAGTVSGDLEVRGSLHEPSVVGALDLQGFSGLGVDIDSAKLAVATRVLQLQVDGIVSGGLTLGSLTLDAQAQADRFVVTEPQTWSTELGWRPRPDLVVDALAQAQLGDDIAVTLTRLDGSQPLAGRWSLTAPSSVTVQGEVFGMSPLCLTRTTESGGSVCLEVEPGAGRPIVSVRVDDVGFENVPVATLTGAASQIDADAAVVSMIVNADAQLLLGDGVEGEVDVGLTGLHIDVAGVAFPIADIDAAARIDDTLVSVILAEPPVDAQTFMSGGLRIDRAREPSPLAGSLTVQAASLAPFEPLAAQWLTDLTGNARAELSFAGRTDEPSVNGRVLIEQVGAYVNALGVRIDDLQVVLVGTGDRLYFNSRGALGKVTLPFPERPEYRRRMSSFVWT